MHLERQWEENFLTFGGRVLHERVEDPFFIESRGSVIITRSQPLISRSLGFYDVADVVEFWRDSSGIAITGHSGRWRPYPVEYSMVDRSLMTGTRCSYVPRQCAWKRC